MTDTNKAYKEGHQDATLNSLQASVDRIEDKVDHLMLDTVTHRECDSRHKTLWFAIGGLASGEMALVGWLISTLLRTA